MAGMSPSIAGRSRARLRNRWPCDVLTTRCLRGPAAVGRGWPRSAAGGDGPRSSTQLGDERAVALQVTRTSVSPLRPYAARTRASAMRTSPSRAGATKVISPPAATVVCPRELQANAKAESARVKTYPPWQVSWPLTIVAVTGIRTTAWSTSTTCASIPRVAEARSSAHIRRTWVRSGSAWVTGAPEVVVGGCVRIGWSAGLRGRVWWAWRVWQSAGGEPGAGR